jgi:TonB family protein
MHAPSSRTPEATPARLDEAEGHLTVHLRDTREVSFLLDRTNRRLGGAFGFSVVTHLVAVVLGVAIITALPPATFPVEEPTDRLTYEMIWLPEEGPGGGGGGGGNQSLEPPRQVEMPGTDRMTVPVAKPVNIEQPQPPKPETAEVPPMELNIPALAMAQGTESIIGTLQGVPDPNSTSQGSGSGGGAGTGRGSGIGPGTGSGLGPGSGGGTGGGVYRPGSGITLPRVLREVKPQYTPDALRAKIQGDVWLDCVVLPTGDVGACEVVRSLDSVFGLDAEAVKAARQWRFVPGTRQGTPVPVMVTIAIGFTLR